MNEVLYNAYVKILKEELLPAMGAGRCGGSM